MWFSIFLGKVIGHSGWTEKIHNNTIISKATCPWDASKPLLFLNDEPYALILFENSESKYEAQFQWKLQNKGAPIPQWSKLKGADPETQELFSSKYSKQDGGKMTFGSWSRAGVTRFNELTNEYIEAKYVNPAQARVGKDLTIKPEWLDWERDYLARARGILGIKDLPVSNKGKKKKVPEEPLVIPLDLDE